jgi:hypothetical protein
MSSTTSTHPTPRPGARAHDGAVPASGATTPAGPVAVPDAVLALLARWRRDGTTFVVVDERGRHRDRLAAGRVDLTRAAGADSRSINATLRRAGFVLLDACNVPRGSRPRVIAGAVAAVERLRVRTGQPTWILVEDAQDVLDEPGIPPHAWRLADGGYCLVARDGGSLPAWAVAGAPRRVRLPGPQLELTIILRPQPGASGVGR